jgi:hypothetical protein
MQRAIRPSALVPRGFDVDSAVCDGAATVITVRPTSGTSLCPGCGASSGRRPARRKKSVTARRMKRPPNRQSSPRRSSDSTMGIASLSGALAYRSCDYHLRSCSDHYRSDCHWSLVGRQPALLRRRSGDNNKYARSLHYDDCLLSRP